MKTVYLYEKNYLFKSLACIKRDFFQEFANKYKGQILYNILHVLSDSFQEIQVQILFSLSQRF